MSESDKYQSYGGSQTLEERVILSFHITQIVNTLNTINHHLIHLLISSLVNFFSNNFFFYVKKKCIKRS